MNPSKFEIILKVLETSSFTKTAEYFGYTQSAISQIVKSVGFQKIYCLFKPSSSGDLSISTHFVKAILLFPCICDPPVIS